MHRSLALSTASKPCVSRVMERGVEPAKRSHIGRGAIGDATISPPWLRPHTTSSSTIGRSARRSHVRSAACPATAPSPCPIRKRLPTGRRPAPPRAAASRAPTSMASGQARTTISRSPAAVARSIARPVGAETVTKVGQPASAAFSTSSNEHRDESSVKPPSQQSPPRSIAPISLSKALWRPTSSRTMRIAPSAPRTKRRHGPRRSRR